jgi:hypothetical protein
VVVHICNPSYVGGGGRRVKETYYTAQAVGKGE